MANVKINRLPSGNFNARVFDYTDANGKRHYQSLTARTKGEVKLMIANFLSERKKPVLSNNDITLGEAIDQYIANKINILSPSTVREYRQIQRNQYQSIMSVPISNITSVMLQQEINNVSLSRAPKTVRNGYGLIFAAIHSAAPEMKFDVLLPQKVKPTIIIPTEDEMRTLLACVKDTDLEIPVMLGAFCAMRRSEIASLKWSDIDLEKGFLSIHSAIVLNEQSEYVEKGTKTTSSTRTIQIFTPVLLILKNARKDSEFVTHLTPQKISNSFFAVLKKSNLRHFRFHDLRHYAVSVMLSLNMPKKYIADYVGHQSERMIDTVYGHIMIHAKNQFMTAVDQYYTALFQKQ